jgi:hypothetical protein
MRDHDRPPDRGDALRELMGQIEQLGYACKGYDSQNAVIMWHPQAGAVRLHARSNGGSYTLNKVQEARRRLRMGDTRYGQFMDWLMAKHEVGRNEQKELQLTIREDAREYLNGHPEGGRLESLVAMLDQDPRLEVLERKQGSKTWRVRMTGINYGLDNLRENPCKTPTHLKDDNEIGQMTLSEVVAELEDLRAENDLVISALENLLDALRDNRVARSRGQ